MKLIKNAKAIVTCNEKDQVFWNEDILIDGPAIKEIGKNLSTLPEVEIIDATDKIVYPGLINTHHHFFQAFIRNLMSVNFPSLEVPAWLDRIYRIFRLVDEDVIYYASMTAFADLVKHGCTTAFDHQYCYTAVSGKKLVDRQMEAAAQIGIRYHAGRGTNTLPRSEGSTMPDDMLETTDEFLSDCERLIGLYHDNSMFSMNQIVVAPCQPINSYKETFVEAAALARKHGVRMHTHLCEGENSIMLERYRKRSLDWCQEVGFFGSDVWYAHGWDLLPEEYEKIGRVGSGVSHCPGPAILGGFPILPICDMQRKGVIVSLGCDGCATNDGSSLLETLRLAYLMQAYNGKTRGECPTPYDILKIATVGGAKTLGRADLGNLVAGKAADLFMLDASRLELTGALHDPKNMVPYCGFTDSVYMTMINGEIVYQNDEILGIDEVRLAKEGEALCNRVLRSKSDAFPPMI